MASATFDQGLRCLPVTSFKLPVLKWVKMRLDNVEIIIIIIIIKKKQCDSSTCKLLQSVLFSSFSAVYVIMLESSCTREHHNKTRLHPSSTKTEESENYIGISFKQVSKEKVSFFN